MPEPDENPERIPRVLEAIREIWTKYPDCRLGQLLAAAACEEETNIDQLFYTDDEELIRKLYIWDDQNRKFVEEQRKERRS